MKSDLGRLWFWPRKPTFIVVSSLEVHYEIHHFWVVWRHHLEKRNALVVPSFFVTCHAFHNRRGR